MDEEARALVAGAGSGVLRPEQIGSTTGRAFLRMYGDDLAGACEDFGAVVEACRRHGASVLLIQALGNLAEAEFRAGRWDDAQMHSDLVVSLAVDGDVTQVAAHVHAIAAQVLARRGDVDQASTHVQAALAASAAPGNESGLAYAATAAAILAHSRADHADVVAATDPLLPLAGLIGAHDPVAPRWQELRVEALVRLGRLAEAEQLASTFTERSVTRGSHSAQANAARVRGLLEATRGRPVAAVQAFEEALAHAAAVDLPFERAMIHLHYGAHLRKTGRRRVAAEQLRAADDIFHRLAARPFVAMAGRELAGCGLTRARTAGPSQLTSQERTVARLVSTGKSNREVAGELFISTKTVEYHLVHIYAKLGLRSRGQLIARLRTSDL
jgi:DNA-binding CsgD family transcriptional regulator